MYKYEGEQSVENFVNFINGKYKKSESFTIPGFNFIAYIKGFIFGLGGLIIIIVISIIFVLIMVRIFNNFRKNKYKKKEIFYKHV